MKVWIVKFDNPAYTDFEGIFSTFERAETSVITNLKDSLHTYIRLYAESPIKEGKSPQWARYAFRRNWPGRTEEIFSIYATKVNKTNKEQKEG